VDLSRYTNALAGSGYVAGTAAGWHATYPSHTNRPHRMNEPFTIKPPCQNPSVTTSVVTVLHWPRSVGFGWVLLKRPRCQSVSVF